jgi:hypothetical protein
MPFIVLHSKQHGAQLSLVYPPAESTRSIQPPSVRLLRETPQ